MLTFVRPHSLLLAVLKPIVETKRRIVVQLLHLVELGNIAVLIVVAQDQLLVRRLAQQQIVGELAACVVVATLIFVVDPP